MPNEETGSRYVAWLKNGHVGAVLAAGATNARGIRVIEPVFPIRYQTQYVLPSVGTYEEYVREYAKALRSEGVTPFGLDSGVTFERIAGTVV